MSSVFYSTPWETGSIGRGMNSFIEALPADAWVCLRDGDTLLLTNDWGKQIEDVVRKHGASYGLIGCMTNRIGGLHQCYGQKFSENHSIKHHAKIARHLRDERWSQVEDLGKLGVAGFFMLFSKETWERAGRFKEAGFSVDTAFNREVRRLGLKIGIARGIYVYHSYRINEDKYQKARYDISHLTHL